MKTTPLFYLASFATQTTAFAPIAPKIFTRSMSTNAGKYEWWLVIYRSIKLHTFSYQILISAVPLANGAMSFDRVCREWRCKVLMCHLDDYRIVFTQTYYLTSCCITYVYIWFQYTGDKATSESLEKVSALVEEYLPQIKAVSKDATVNRLVCGACLDFKLMTTVSLHTVLQLPIILWFNTRLLVD